MRDDSSLLLTLEFPAADASNFAVGQAAQVMLNGTFETLSGTVQAVAGTDTISSGNLLVRTVTIAVPNNGSLTTAQAASASINGVSALASGQVRLPAPADRHSHHQRAPCPLSVSKRALPLRRTRPLCSFPAPS